MLGRFIVGGITHIDYEEVNRYRATYTIETRRVVVRTEPLARKVKPSGVLPTHARSILGRPTSSPNSPPRARLRRARRAAGKDGISVQRVSGWAMCSVMSVAQPVAWCRTAAAR